MKVILAAAATAALLAGAAIAGNNTTSPTKAQFAALSKRVSTLEVRLASLTKSNNELVGYVNTCAGNFIGVNQYGTANSDLGDGYVYDPGDGSGDYKTTALDLTQSGDKTSYWLVSAPASCVKASRLYSYQRR